MDQQPQPPCDLRPGACTPTRDPCAQARPPWSSSSGSPSCAADLLRANFFEFATLSSAAWVSTYSSRLQVRSAAISCATIGEFFDEYWNEVGVVFLEGVGGANHPRFSLSFWRAKSWLILPSLNRRVNRGVNRGFRELEVKRRRKSRFFLRWKSETPWDKLLTLKSLS